MILILKIENLSQNLVFQITMTNKEPYLRKYYKEYAGKFLLGACYFEKRKYRF